MVRPRAVLPALCLIVLVGCSAEHQAESDAEDQIADELKEAESWLYSRWVAAPSEEFPLLTPTEIHGTGTFLRYGVEERSDGSIAEDWIVRRVGRAALELLTDTTVSAAACFSVSGPPGGVPEIEQVDCPASEVDRPGDPIAYEPELISEAREVECDTETSSCGDEPSRRGG